jgi:hypothetical protein
MSKEEAYEIVFEDLKKHPLYCGSYDAKHGNEHFMYGIANVMEYITLNISDEVHDEFINKFYNNMIAAEAQR